MTVAWTDAEVACEDLGPFHAQIANQRWNGFVCPRFTREVAEELVTQFNTPTEEYPNSDPDASYNNRMWWDGDVVVLSGPDFSFPDEPDERVEPDADGMYAIGAWCWTWTLTE